MQQENPAAEDLKHQFELLKTKVEADMKVSQAERNKAKAESDSALERLRVTITDHNAKMPEQSKEVIKFIATMSVGIVAILGVFIAFLQFYK